MATSLLKKELRENIKRKISLLSPDEKRDASLTIREALLIHETFRKAKSIMFYVSTDQEVDTSILMQDVLSKGIQVWVPWCDVKNFAIVPVKITNPQHDLSEGAYGIRSPKAPRDLGTPPDFNPDIVLVPGVAFDKKGGRLGRGLGYYDKFLALLPKHTLKIGLAFACQMVEEVPMESFDERLQQVIWA